MKKIFVILFACIGLNAFGQELEPITTTNLRVIMSKINELQGLVGTGGLSQQQVSNIVKDSIDAVIDRGIDLDTELAGYEPALGNPDQNGYVLSSTAEGVRSWIAPPEGGGNGYDDTAINNRIDSLVAEIEILQGEIEDLWAALDKLGDFDLVAPRFVSAEVGATGDDIVVITMDEELDDTSVPATTAFIFSDGNSGISVIDVDIEDEYITLTLDGDAEYGETYTVSYTQPETNPLQDIAENKTKSWENREVTNNVAEPQPEPENMVYNGDFSEGDAGWTFLGENLSIINESCYYDGSGYPSLVQGDGEMISPLLYSRSYIIEFDVVPDNNSIYIRIMDSGNNSIGHNGEEFTLGRHSVSGTITREGEWGIRFSFSPDNGGYIDNIVIYEKED